MIFSALLATVLMGPPVPPCSMVRPGTVCVEDRQRSESEDRKIIRGLVHDTARIGLGASLDIYSTAYALDKRPDLRESNPLGITPEARIALKGAMAVGTVLGCHEMRVRGHHGWAKWTARVVMVAQIGFAVHNFRLARQGPKP